MIGARATKRRMVHGKSSEAEVGPAQERKTFLNRYGWDKILPHVRNELKMYFFLSDTSSMVGTRFCHM